MPRTKILSKTFFAMGTANTITIPEKYADVAEDIRSFIMTLHDLVNVFDDRSELSEINRMAGRQDVTVNPNTFRLLVHAERARLKTGGSFHAGLLPAIQIWRKAKETHIFYVHGSGEIQVRSWHKGLNNAIRKLQQDEPQSVWIDESDEPGYLQAAVKVGRLTFRTVRSPTEKSRAAQSAAGKQHAGNLRHQKEKAPP